MSNINKNISAYNKTKISIISFVLVIMILYVHGIYSGVESFCLANIVKCIISRLSYRVINPTFFTISGFLFFKGINAAADCFPKIKKRVRTIIVPFILWNLIYIAESIAFSKTPIIKEFFKADIISEFQTLQGGLRYILLDPAAFHLWFLRDLIVYIAITPLIFWCIKKIGWWVFCIMLIATPPIMTLFEFFHFDIAFFIVGGTVALRSSLESVHTFLSKPIVIISALFYFSLSVIWDFWFPEEFCGQEYLSIFFSICGMITLWRGYDWLAKRTNLSNNRFILSLTGYSFFIYLFHEPILFAVMQLGWITLGFNSISVTFLYIVNPFVIIFIGVCIAKIFKILSPTAYSILVGGRVSRHQNRI